MCSVIIKLKKKPKEKGKIKPLTFGVLHLEAFFSPKEIFVALFSSQGGKCACKFHPRESISLHPLHQERIDTSPQAYAKSQKFDQRLAGGGGGWGESKGWNYARKATQPGRKFQ